MKMEVPDEKLIAKHIVIDLDIRVQQKQSDTQKLKVYNMPTFPQKNTIMVNSISFACIVNY